MSEITTLDGLTTGCFVITTHNGTRHIIDLDAKTAIRLGAPGREWGETTFAVIPNACLSGTQPKVTVVEVPTTPDGQVFHFINIQGVTVGQSMRLDAPDEWRMTSTIRSIEIAMPTDIPGGGDPCEACDVPLIEHSHDELVYCALHPKGVNVTSGCPTLCDPGCDEPCHEVHLVRWKRDHEPESCPGG